MVMVVFLRVLVIMGALTPDATQHTPPEVPGRVRTQAHASSLSVKKKPCTTPWHGREGWEGRGGGWREGVRTGMLMGSKNVGPRAAQQEAVVACKVPAAAWGALLLWLRGRGWCFVFVVSQHTYEHLHVSTSARVKRAGLLRCEVRCRLAVTSFASCQDRQEFVCRNFAQSKFLFCLGRCREYGNLRSGSHQDENVYLLWRLYWQLSVVFLP